MRRHARYSETVSRRGWRFRDIRLWVVAGLIVAALLALWFVRAFQLMPLLIPPPPATSTLTSSTHPLNWPSVRRDAQGTAWAPETTPAAPFVVRWEVATPGTVLGAPAVLGDRLFACTDAGLALALDADTGATLWERDIGSPSDSSPAIAGDLLYLGTRDHRVVALDLVTGEPRWEHDLGNIVLGSPIVANGTLYIGSTNGNLAALDAATGDPRWSADANGWVVAHPATDGLVVAATSLGERFITIDPETGRRRLVFYSGTPVAGGPVITDGSAFFVTNHGAVWAVDPAAISRPFSRFAYVAKFNFFAWRLRSDPPRQTGALWVASAGGKVKYSPAYASGKLFVANETGKTTAFNGADGSSVWETQLDGEIVGDPFVAGDTLILGASDGSLHGLDIATGSLLWTHDIGDHAMSAAPSVSGRTLFVPTVDGKLIALQGK